MSIPIYAEKKTPDFSEEEQQWLSDHPVLYYAPDPEFAPYEYFEDGQFKGIISDYLPILEEILNIKIEVIQTESWSQVLDLAKNNEADFVFLTKTNERSEYLDFTESFIISPNVILVNDNFQEKVDADNLGEFSVGVIKEYASTEFAKLIYPEAKITEYPTVNEGLLDLSFGNIDAFLVDLGQGSYYVKKLNINNLSVADKIAYEYKFTFGVPIENEMLPSILDQAVKSIPRNEHKAIMDKWVEIQYKEWLSSEQTKWVAIVSMVIVFVALGILIWNRTLRKIVNEKTLELNTLNKELENKVEQRTEELKELNVELQISLDDLMIMQDKLVESKKYAALGEIVSGVAHEINTPIGNGITSISYAKKELEQLQTSLDENNLSKSQLKNSFSDFEETFDIVFSSLNKVGNITSKFKELEISQITSRIEEFDLREEMESIIEKHGFRQEHDGNVAIDLMFEDVIRVNTSKRWLEEIVVHLIVNSMTHGFQNSKSGLIIIKAEQLTDSKIRIIYEDNGIGISNVAKERVFDPFYSDGKMAQNMGLGLSVVYNIVVRHLSGSVELETVENEFTRFIIELPVNDTNQ